MATLTGRQPVTILYPDEQDVCSISIKDKSPTSSTLSILDIDEVSVAENGSKVNNLPVTERESTLVGHEQITFRNDYYYRVHVAPQTIALGAILSPINEEFIVWNAWFQAKSLSQIVKTNPTEYTLTGQTAPFDFRALQLKTYEIDVPEEGSTEFTATITFDFTTESPVVTISGTRIATFAWEPKFPMKETLSWLTQIIKGKSGSEQRISLRRTPRQGFKFDIFFHDEQEQAKFEAQLFTWQKRSWGVPVWAEKVAHSGTINAGDTSISVDTRYADFRDDSLAIIYQDKDNYEVVKVSTKTDSSLTLEVEMQNSFTGNKFIMPVRVAQMPVRARNKMTPDGHSFASCEFLVTLNTLLTGYTPVETYKSLAVILDPSYAEDAQDFESDGDITISDGGTGPFDIFSDSEFNIVSQSQVFKNWSKMGCWTFRNLLHYLYGRQVAVWMPTYKNDLQLSQAIGASDVNFRIQNIKLADNMGVNDLRTDIAFMFPDGTNYYREITGIVEHSDTEEIITIDSSIGIPISPGDCEICFLDKVRLASDEVEIDWIEPYRNMSDTRFVKVEE
jgi:hypothetical protein